MLHRSDSDEMVSHSRRSNALNQATASFGCNGKIVKSQGCETLYIVVVLKHENTYLGVALKREIGGSQA